MQGNRNYLSDKCTRTAQRCKPGTGRIRMQRHSSIVLLLTLLSLPGPPARADQIVCTADGKGNDSCDVLLPNVLSAQTVSSVGGACFAKSTDGGLSFAVSQCISNTSQPVPAGHFYDGESLAATPLGAIYAAFNDLTTSRINVRRALNVNSQFVQLPEPFPNMMSPMHPRLRAGADGSIYVAAPFAATLPDGTTGPVVYMNRYVNGA
jgi:hypothetical protein